MEAGALRHRVAIQEPVEARNSYNEVIVTWALVAVVWAWVAPLSGREFFAAEHVQSEITHRVRLRYRAGITPEMRVVMNGRVLMIQSVIDRGERRRELELMCKETR